MVNVKHTLINSMLWAGLQMTDVDLDARVTALEESSGGNSPNGNWFKLSEAE